MYSKLAFLGALFAGAAQATGLSPAVVNLAQSWDEKTLFKGAVDAKTNLELGIIKGAVNGDVSIDASLPNIEIDLSDLEVYIDLNITANAAAYTSIELIAATELALNVAGVAEAGVKAGLGLHLLVGLSAAVDIHTGFTAKFPKGSKVVVSLLTKEIVDSNLTGVLSQALELQIAAGLALDAEVKVDLGLQARLDLCVEAGVDLLGLEIEAGTCAAIWISIVDLTQTIISTPECPLSVVEQFKLTLGLAVKVVANVLNILELDLTPELWLTIGAGAEISLCLPSGTKPGPGSGNGGGNGGSGTTSPAPVSTTSPGTGSGGSGPGNGGSGTTTPAPVSTASAGAGSGNGGDVTSTIISTHTVTVTACNAGQYSACPGSQKTKVTTVVIESTVTTCPLSGYPTTTPASVVVPPAPSGTPYIITSVPVSTSTLSPAAGGSGYPATTISVPTIAKPTGGAGSYPVGNGPYPGGNGTTGNYPVTGKPVSTTLYPVATPQASASSTYPATYPSNTVVTAGAGRVGASGALVVAVLFAML